jgi:hypothetical protein
MPRVVGGLKSSTCSERDTWKSHVSPVSVFVYGGEIISRTVAEPSLWNQTSVQQVPIPTLPGGGPPPWSRQRCWPGLRRK